MRIRGYASVQDAEAQARCRAILAKRHANWRRDRWFHLLGGAINIAVGAFFLSVAQERASSAVAWDQEAVLLYPISIAMLTTGGVLAARALSKWRGDPVVAVLLGLLHRGSRPLDEQQGRSTLRPGTEHGPEPAPGRGHSE
ncbi:MAG: hypothetical protein ABSF95_17425 [Verrucomicrobiota bacterium]|jgi:hypothetical protein